MDGVRQVQTAEVPIQGASIKASGSATPDQLVEMANRIFSRVRRSGVRQEDEEANEELYKEIRDEYKDFSTSFPLVLRWMIGMREFDEKAFRTFLSKMGNGFWPKRIDFLKFQVEYLVLVFKNKHPRTPAADIGRYREAMEKQVLEEDREFSEIKEEADEEVKRAAKEADAERRRRLYEFLKSRRSGPKGAGGQDTPQ